MSLLILCCAPAAIAFLVIFGIQLNGINPWAGKGVPQLVRDVAFAVLIVFLLKLASDKFFVFIGGAR
ncbi:MAG TPA: hypothetical protein VGU67_02770 [Edaphobacter sp.]|nr:hypothetical protein [Edaphobacter sp.]